MRIRQLFAVVAVSCLASRAGAMTLRVGLSHVAAEYEYAQTDLNAKGSPATNRSDAYTVSVVSLEGESLTAIDEHFAAGFSVGASTTGEYVFNQENMFNPAAGTPNPNSGDTITMDFSRMPVLLRAAGMIPAGPGMARLDLGVGAQVIAWQAQVLDQLWADSTGAVSTIKDTTHTTEAGTRTNYNTGTVTLFDIEITPGYHYKIAPKDFIGLEIPVSITGKKKVAGQVTDLTTAPANGSSNPLNSQPGCQVGGFTWGAQLAWTHTL